MTQQVDPDDNADLTDPEEVSESIARLHKEFSRALRDGVEPLVTWKTKVDEDGVVIKQAEDVEFPEQGERGSIGRKVGEQLVRDWFDKAEDRG